MKLWELKHQPDFLYCPIHFISFSRLRYMVDPPVLSNGCPLCIRDRNAAIKAEHMKKKKERKHD